MGLRKKVVHAVARARQRVGLDVDNSTLAGWVRSIDAGQARYVRICDRETRVYEVVHEGQWVRVVYHEPTRCIRTVHGSHREFLARARPGRKTPGSSRRRILEGRELDPEELSWN